MNSTDTLPLRGIELGPRSPRQISSWNGFYRPLISSSNKSPMRHLRWFSRLGLIFLLHGCGSHKRNNTEKTGRNMTNLNLSLGTTSCSAISQQTGIFRMSDKLQTLSGPSI
jgi:hypothetical protein